jgi:atrial natriuretic peptide-converting enzyme
VFYIVKQVLKHADDISKEIADNNANTAAAIIKSASTPASLQTIVRLSNGSNMSLQHKVCYWMKKKHNKGM